MTTKEIGDFGENAACEYLERHDMKVIERNFRIRGGEIDIIAHDGDAVVFVEVKTRKSSEYGSPCEFVNYRKQRKLIETALSYLGRDDVQMRFDVAEVLYERRLGKMHVRTINYIKNAFGA